MPIANCLESQKAESFLRQIPEDSFRIKGCKEAIWRLPLYRLPFLCRRPSLWRGKLIQVLQSDVDLFCQLGIGFPALFRLVKRRWLRREMAHQSGWIITRPFEFLRVPNGSGRTRLRAKSTIHALANVDIEMSKFPLLGLFVHFDTDRDASNRTVSFTRQAAGAVIEVHFQNTAVAMGQGFLNRHGNLIRILDRHRTANQMREGNRHPLEDRFHGVRDIPYVTTNAHKTSFA